MQDTVKINIKNAKDITKKLWISENKKVSSIVPLLRGGSGIGKSESVKQLWNDEEINQGLTPVETSKPSAKEFGLVQIMGSHYGVQDLYLPTYDKDQDEMVHKFMELLPKDKDSKGIAFLDEVGSASPDVQKVFQSLILERKIGSYELPKGWKIIGATNRKEDNAGVGNLNMAMLNRTMVLDVEFSHESWDLWASQNNVHPTITSYFRFEPQNLWNYDRKNKSEQFCSPRSAVSLSEILNADAVDDENRLAIYQGEVGSEVAQNILAFQNTLAKAPSIESIIENPEEADYIDSNDVNIRFAVTGALLQKTKEGDTKKRIEQVFTSAIQYLNRFESSEFTVFFTQHGIRQNKDLMNTKAFTDFSLANTEIDFV